MKKFIKQAVLLSVMFPYILSSCDDNVDGKASDTIKLSTSNVIFNKSSDSIQITTKSDFWWICEMKESGKYIDIGDLNKDSTKDFQYTGQWYKIKRESKIISISVTENTSGKARQLNINLQAGNWFGSSITVNQKAE